jgi:hypothetical protein
MDTDIGNPIEYNPEVTEEEEPPVPSPPQYYFPQAMMAPPPPPEPKKDFLANLDKTAYLVIFAAFILGFFMGKTMQPVILRHG